MVRGLPSVTPGFFVLMSMKPARTVASFWDERANDQGDGKSAAAACGPKEEV
jgi:hypothetical protein